MGLMPPEGVHGPDMNKILPNPVQAWSYQRWEQFWAWVNETAAQYGATRRLIAYVGDLFEGKKFAHGAQIVSENHEPQAYIGDRIIGPHSVVASYNAEAIAVIRGTEVHVGPVGESEEAFGRRMKAAQRPDGAWSWWVWRPEFYGRLLDFRHHPSNYGTKPWTDKAAVVREAKQVFYEHCENGERAPDIAIRGHVHYPADSYDACPTRALFLPPWQAKTMHAHKVASNAIGKVGGYVTVIEPNGEYAIHKFIRKPDEPTPWRLPDVGCEHATGCGGGDEAHPAECGLANSGGDPRRGAAGGTGNRAECRQGAADGAGEGGEG